jgi:hypothetical protein
MIATLGFVAATSSRLRGQAGRGNWRRFHKLCCRDRLDALHALHARRDASQKITRFRHVISIVARQSGEWEVNCVLSETPHMRFLQGHFTAKWPLIPTPHSPYLFLFPRLIPESVTKASACSAVIKASPRIFKRRPLKIVAPPAPWLRTYPFSGASRRFARV